MAITAYNGVSIIAGPNALGSATYSLSQQKDSYSIEFTATSANTNIGFRSDGFHTVLRNAKVTPKTYSLNLEASPEMGGTPSATTDLLAEGEVATLTANTNPGYHFVNWEIVSGTNVRIGSITSPETTVTMGSSDAVIRAVYEENQPGEVHVYYLDQDGHEIEEMDVLEGVVGDSYHTEAKEIEHYELIDMPDDASGIFTEEMIIVTYVYEARKVSPVDPISPETDVDPENKPTLPEHQGLLSIDFASQLEFGKQGISVQDRTYYAQPQRLLNEEGAVNEEEIRPNYIQISDRRPESEKTGWQLAVTQNGQFKAQEDQELDGARIQLTNQQLATSGNGIEPKLQQPNSLSLVPGVRQTLLMAQGNEGKGTWIYRFGDRTTAGESVMLDIPKGANPEAQRYSTTLNWELSMVPEN